ncbi:glycosyltransferase family 87 protein [Saccharopolyspora gloriosae]|uniref:glycosyltransferase family 87 protein n=1 Tax=Saccharopolyspora gloriosae TaxID=455344 RepID=UPI001FB6F7BD|nr:glycosyltransferase 87 family protein [Saccharopolyspora gloriosae]
MQLPAEPASGAPSGAGRRLTFAALALLCLITALTLAAGHANKARCTGPEFNEWGRSEPAYQERAYSEVCYSDIQNLWIGRDIDRHVFPYVHGGMDEDGSLYGGVVEYPVLSGLLIWLGAVFVDTDAGFLAASALIMAPFGLGVAWWLGRLSGWRALLWALSPPLVLYAFHNWDLPVVACAVAAVFVVHRGGAALRHRALWGAVLLGAGFAFKIYPGLFVLPLALFVLTGGRDGAALPVGKRFDVRGALAVVGAAVGTAVVANLPFALAGFRGWLASFAFQSDRQVDLSTNSIWYWGLRGVADADGFQDAMSVVSPVAMLLSFAAACLAGRWVQRRTGTYPWIQVSAAMLCGFLLLHKVHSPQYTLWLLPFFVLLRVRWGWVVAYVLADLAMGISIFRWLAEADGINDGFTAQALMIGVWGRAALLVGLFPAFLGSTSTVDEDERSALERRVNQQPSHDGT